MKQIKNESLCAINERKSPCTRCGLNFTQHHLAICVLKNEKCSYCATIDPLARTRKRPKTSNMRGRGRFAGRAGKRRIKLIEQDDNQSKKAQNKMKTTWCCTLVVAETNGSYWKERNTQRFSAMIESSSPTPKITQPNLKKKLLRLDVRFARPTPKQVQYEDYNNKPLNIMGFGVHNNGCESGKKKQQKCPNCQHER